MGLILGHHLPFGAGGGGPGGPGYTFGGDSGLNSQSNGDVPPGPYSVSAPGGTAAGDLLVVWAAIGPGYPGQSNITLREGIGFNPWSPTGGITSLDLGIGRTVLTIQPRIAAGDITDNVIMFGAGPFPFALQMVLFKNAWPFGLGSITADNEESQAKPDASFFREDAPNNGFDHLLDVFASTKKATIGMAGNLTTLDPSQPTITILSKIDYADNGFGDGMVLVFGYRITPDGNPGIPSGNWGLSILENNDRYAVSARWKSADS